MHQLNNFAVKHEFILKNIAVNILFFSSVRNLGACSTCFLQFYSNIYSNIFHKCHKTD